MPGQKPGALLCEERRTKQTQWMYFVGNRVVIPARGQQQLLEDLHPSTKNSQNEKPGALLPMVVGVG